MSRIILDDDAFEGRERIIDHIDADEFQVEGLPDAFATSVDGIERPPGGETLIRRATNGRPYVYPVDPEGNPIRMKTNYTYTRVTTFIDKIDDNRNIHRWQMREMLAFLATPAGESFLLEAASFNPEKMDYKGRMNDLCERILERAGTKDRAAKGTALHAVTERNDMGMDVSRIPSRYHPHLAAYREFTRHFGMVEIEQFVVNDKYETGGTPDRVIEYKPCKHCGSSLFIEDLKGLSLNTPIPTPDGWTTMGAVNVGDIVFDSDGKQCRVTAKSNVKRIGTYIVKFDDGTSITCDSEHLWWTMSGSPTKASRDYMREQVLDIETIRKTLFGGNGQRQHRVPVAQALQLPERALPLPPYTFGAWLGDGNKNRPVVSKESELFEYIAAEGVNLGVEQIDSRTGVVTRSLLGMKSTLQEMGVLGHKFIPQAYLRASFEQRLELLRGLMDTDGTWNRPRSQAVFTSTGKELALGVVELLASLGQRPVMNEVARFGFGISVMSYDVKFTPMGFNPFHLSRKADLVVAPAWIRSKYRIIKSVEPGPDVETQCIAVDSPNHTYLCGESMVPTHNTGRVDNYTMLGIAMQLALYAHSRKYNIEIGTRTDLPPICMHKGVVIHLPAHSADPFSEGGVKWVNIARGWRYVDLCSQITAARAENNLVVPFVPTVNVWPILRQCNSKSEVRNVFEAHRSEFDADERLHELMRLRMEELP